jgi:hypothetical protein
MHLTTPTTRRLMIASAAAGCKRLLDRVKAVSGPGDPGDPESSGCRRPLPADAY